MAELGAGQASTSDRDAAATRIPTRELLIACCAIVAIWLVAASRWIVTDTVVPWDSKNQFYAFFRFLAASLHAGVSPFWNPYHYGGQSSVADPQSLIFAPVFFLWALFDAAPSLHAFDLVVYAHLLAGGLAVGVIGWRAGWPAAACVLAACVFMFGGSAAGRLQHTGNILCYGLFPPALLLLDLALERRSLLIGVAFAVVAAALVLARNQLALLLCFALMALVIARIAAATRPWRYLRERLLVLGTMGAVGLALIAVPLLLTLQFAALSNRPAEQLEAALKGSYYPLNLAQLMVADIFVSGGQYWGPGPWSMPEIAYTDDSFNYIFVGWVPIVLLLWFGVAGGRLFRRGRLVFVGIMIAALIYALGRYTPVFAFAFEYVPGVDKFRRPVDANFVVIAMLAFLTGHLLTDYMREGVPRRRTVASLTLAACALALLSGAVMFMARSHHAEVSLIATAKTTPIPLGVILVLALMRTPRQRSVAAALVALVAVSELVWWNAAFRLNSESRSVYAVLEQPDPSDEQVLALLDRAIAEDHARGEHPRVEIVGMGGPWQNVAMVRRFEATNGYNPLRIGLYNRLVAPGEGNWLVDLRNFPPSFDGYDSPLARKLGLKYVVLDRPIEQMPHLTKAPAADVLEAGPRAWIYRLHNPSPRVEFLTKIEVADAGAPTGSGQLLTSPASDRALIEGETPPSRNYAEAPPGTARIASWRGDRVEIDADSVKGGILVLHDIDYPGWEAEIDGRSAPVLRADVLFRGVELPAGSHHIVFRFAPFSLSNLKSALMLALHPPRHRMDLAQGD